MNQKQRNDLHSVIAHGLVALRSRKLILEGKIHTFENGSAFSKDGDLRLLADVALTALKEELFELNEKLVIGSNALLELEGVSTAVRGMSDIFMGDASELQDELPGIIGQRMTQIFKDEGETK